MHAHLPHALLCEGLLKHLNEVWFAAWKQSALQILRAHLDSSERST